MGAVLRKVNDYSYFLLLGASLFTQHIEGEPTIPLEEPRIGVQ